MAKPDPINMPNVLRFVAGVVAGGVLGVVGGFAADSMLQRYRWQPPSLAEQAAASPEGGAVRTVADQRDRLLLQRCRGACDAVQ
jgi:hypothetical protein